ncbi:leucyl/phenylalanyl-tRNA--protein transferase [bacterium]|nr:leucyl/phenylalanyl-tRNA--protein transferase [bacterium]
MVISRFPPTHLSDEHGLLAVGGDVEVDSLLLAYRSGIFPWPLREDVLTWFAPPERAVLEGEHLLISRSLKRFLRQHRYTIALNQNFEQVVKCCQQATNRRDQQGTWITDELVAGYVALHRAGYAHSVECYDGEALVGGLYGVSIGETFAGESMFHHVDNASKLCLCFLLDWVTKAGVPWIDCQVLTPLTESFGAREVPREEFEEMLREQLRKGEKKLFPIQPENYGVWRPLG